MTIRMTSVRRGIAGVAVAGLLGFGLAACGGDDSGDDASSSPSASVEATPEDEASDKGDDEGDDTAASGDVADFCAAGENLGQIGTAMSSIDPTDPAAAVAALEEMTTELESLDPPAEIAEDWGVVTGFFTGMTDAMKALMEDPTDAEAMQKMTEASTIMSDPEFTAATTAISKFQMENC